MIINSSMRSILPTDDALLGVSRESVPVDVLAVVAAGWSIGPTGSLILTALSGEGKKAHIPAADVGEYEYHVNDMYVSLADLRVSMSSYLSKAAARGIWFGRQMLELGATLPGASTLCAIISVFVDLNSADFDLQGATVRFTTRRGGQPDWLDDLDRFHHNAIAVVEMSDIAPL